MPQYLASPLAASSAAPAATSAAASAASLASPAEPLPDAPTQRCAPPPGLLELATPPFLDEPTLRAAIPTIFVELPELDAPHPLADTATLRSPFFLGDEAPIPSLLDDAPFSASLTAAFLAARDDSPATVPTCFDDTLSARSPAPLLGDRTARASSIFDEDGAIHEIHDERAAPHSLPAPCPPSRPRSLPDPSATCLAIPISPADELDDSSELYDGDGDGDGARGAALDDDDHLDDLDDLDDFEPVPTILDNLPTLAAPQSPEAPPRWAIGLSRNEGLELVLALPTAPAPPPDGPFALSLPLRQQMITALEARVGVSLDSPVRRDLLDEDLHLPLVAGAVRISLDLADGEILFGAPLYHAWLAHERELARLRHEPTRPGLPPRTAQDQLT